MLVRKPISREELREKLRSLKEGDVRTAKVCSVQDAIRSGLYEDDRKLGIAVDNLLAELNGEEWRRKKAS